MSDSSVRCPALLALRCKAACLLASIRFLCSSVVALVASVDLELMGAATSVDLEPCSGLHVFRRLRKCSLNSQLNCAVLLGRIASRRATLLRFLERLRCRFGGGEGVRSC